MKADLENSPKLEDLELEEIPKIFESQREFFKTGVTHEVDFRIKQLRKLIDAIKANEEEIAKAIYLDMGRAFFEGWGAEVGLVIAEAKHAIKNLKKWVKPEKVRPGLVHFKSKTTIEHVPKGVSLIVSAWNYPFHLCLMPLVSTIAAGNTALIKPSEYATHSAKLLDEIIEEYFDKEYIDIIPGGIATAQTLMKQGFDQIMFTGSERVGKIYAKAAAETLTPIILELGGKSPTIVHPSAKLDIAAQRILFGKFVNASQTCIAPDYLLVHKDVKDELISLMIKHLREFYGQEPQDSDDYARIINEGHFKRITALLSEVEDQVILGGTVEDEELFIEPTLIDEPGLDTRIMNEEIFGPLLPILEYEKFDDLINVIEQNKNPLVKYIFAEDEEFITKVRRNIASGDVAINDTALHFAVAGLKVGGVRNSGLGGYRGKVGFEAFSHKQSVYRKSTFFNLPFTKPPYTSFKEKLLKFFLG